MRCGAGGEQVAGGGLGRLRRVGQVGVEPGPGELGRSGATIGLRPDRDAGAAPGAGAVMTARASAYLAPSAVAAARIVTRQR
jgi:hypothetical protein